ncbi:MAG: citryl-CoA lyase [Gammaproteobacteria bacterium]|nr:citryl-CoA lyase [Gammaproteobacteria bacterium]MBU1601769.1 citryl-CoA lyase [Gammaproteobacteria bacterium]MBU2432141.1 citryl-CoA lyase [Gammaproteobacteria bacterium]MBU2450466.1 citryl-CoA lyase [Gammaproteobacteria bacterium]
MNGPDLLAANASILRTRVGACWPGERAVFRGHDLHADLHGIDWMALYVFGITGRHFGPEQIRLLHGIWTLTSYPDSRLWNNRVAAIAANTRSSSVLGLAAGIAITEAGVYGGRPGIRAIDFFLRAGTAVSAGGEIGEFVARELASRRIYGYGRPINCIDERLPPLIKLVESLGFEQGQHYRLAFKVEKILVGEYKPFLKMNFAALTAALAADLGFTPRQYHLFNILKTLAGIPPCILEAAEKPAGALFPTRCNDIDYRGQAPRPWTGSTENT